MNDYVTVSRLACLENVPIATAKMRILRGKYGTARQADGNGIGRGGKIWLININDPAISENARKKYHQQIPAELREDSLETGIPAASRALHDSTQDSKGIVNKLKSVASFLNKLAQALEELE